jgi:2-oxoglutarate dehydrogenase E2 component (dihydrolipoamide succinyltransferase)
VAQPLAADGSVTSGLILSPVVRRILADGEVEPSTVIGTGHGGVITRRDAERAVALGPTEEIVRTQSNGHRRMGLYLSLSAQQVPHGFVAVEVDAAFAAALDTAGRDTAEGFTVTDEVVVAMAAVHALADFPDLNAYYLENEIVVQRSINIGFTRHEDDDAMLVPVVHAAANLSTSLLARRVSELDDRNAARQLNADDLMGATFSVARAPSANTLTHQPIIVQPQVAVLSIGAVRTVPVVVDRDGTPAIAVGHRVVLGLSFDHRVCDGVVAAAFVERVGALLDDVAAER